ncbi:MAG: hypothetical protein K2M04_01285 [Muribaculaceae bacterium]|nr:hypothetical protein [Muribaculaceae bacterium]
MKSILNMKSLQNMNAVSTFLLPALCLLCSSQPVAADDVMEQGYVHDMSETYTVPTYNCGQIWFNASKDGNTIYGILTLKDGEELPRTIDWTGNEPAGKITLLSNNKNLKYSSADGRTTVTLPAGMKNEPFAFKFRIKK